MSKQWLAIAATAMFAAGSARSAVIVDWGVGDYVSSNQSLGRAGTVTTVDYNGDSNDDRLRRAAFDTTVALSPSSGYAGTSATFYGGFDLVRFTTTSDPSFNDSFVLNGGASGSTTDDGFGWRVQISGAYVYWAAAIVWKKSDFLGGGDSSPVIFDTTSSVTASVGDNSSTTLRWENLQGRWLVQEGTQWYVSQTALATGTGDKSLTFSTDSSDGNWAPIDFSSGVGVDLTGLTYSDTNFTNISGIGLYLTSREDRAPDTATGRRYWWYVDDFTVNATVIPEPASAGLLLGAGGLLLLRRRLRSV